VEWNLRNTTSLMAFKIRFRREAATVTKKALLESLEGLEGRQDPPFFLFLLSVSLRSSRQRQEVAFLKGMEVKFHAFLT